ncbi:hypothetical protein CONCODRAFT_3487 [Conidiobolus coronatus NRRL 28638]|uniref:Uncharacterized protein n=1 Tax=Conidiobolus coronatus (strain ATCC 28846 / CBS 209.66 / NRRL 28638) TaxID=796925 RepID=A0A137PEU7_CONC2|nr:hypothetical protein CONCODRAFT_3487 [Conidiobolus coronatus NRRL 28638]|eukprot:KXN73528.1 hypothetical protein CONCODRAFT_3487 [Conidiobolus coronatus NRRL 28638]
MKISNFALLFASSALCQQNNGDQGAMSSAGNIVNSGISAAATMVSNAANTIANAGSHATSAANAGAASAASTMASAASTMSGAAGSMKSSMSSAASASSSRSSSYGTQVAPNTLAISFVSLSSVALATYLFL